MSSNTAHRNDDKRSIDLLLVVVCLICILSAVFAFAYYPVASERVASIIFKGAAKVLSAPVLILFFTFVLLVFFIIFSKYGDIRLGNEKPEFKTITWVFMFICAGLSSATLYWGMVEWCYYYYTPGLNIEPRSQQALDMSLSYAFFHWGFGTWSCYAIAGLSMAYVFHIKKQKSLSLGGIFEEITGFKAKGMVGRIIDLCFLIGTIGGLTITMVVTTKTFSQGLSDLIGIPNTLWLQAGTVLLIASIFSLSSYIGIAGGMRRISSIVGWSVFGFAFIIILVGPTGFIVNNTVASVGHMFSNIIDMFLFADPYGDGAFTRDWTVFFWFWAIAYTPAVGIFVARISRGRTLREVALALIIGGSTSCWIIFGIFGSYSCYQFFNNILDVPQIVMNEGGDVAINYILKGLPMSVLFAVAYLFVMIMFLASHVDAAAFTIATTTTRNLKEGQDPSPFLRLFWCVMVALVPLTMIYSNVSLSTVKTSVVLTAVPFLFFLLLMAYGLIKWLKDHDKNEHFSDMKTDKKES